MKQPEDTKTIDLIETQKRGRGRPAVAHPLTQAERAKRYRASKKQNPVIKSDVTENNFWKFSESLKLRQSDLDAEKEFTRQWFETSKRFEKEYKAEKKRADSLQHEAENLRVALDNANEQIKVLQARLAIKSDATKTADYFERWRLSDAAEIKLLHGDVTSLRNKNASLAVECAAIYDALDSLTSSVSRGDLGREFILNCESAKAKVDAIRKKKVTRHKKQIID